MFRAWKASALFAVGFAVVCNAASFSIDYAGPQAASRMKAAAAGAVQQTLDAGVLRRVELPASAAPAVPDGLSVGDILDVRLFDDCSITLLLAEQMPSQADRVAFAATADGYDGQMVAVVVLKDGNLHIDVQDFLTGRVYSVFSSAERTVVKEIDPRLAPSRCGGSEAPDASFAGAKAKRRAAPGGLKAGGGDPAFALVDILVVYDTMAASWAKSEGGGVDAFAEVQVQKMNAVLANTELDQCFRFRLVGVYEVGGSAGGSIQNALHAAQSGTMILNGVLWDGVKAMRDEVEADLVCVLLDNGSAYGTTGRGYSLVADSGDFSEYGYNACLIRSVAIAQTMTHEVGHNMGAGHATEVADESNRGPQYHSYSSGHYFTGSDGIGYHTVMAYDSDGYGNYYESAPYFSSPDYRYKSVPVGDASHNNSLTLRQTYPTVAAYRGGSLVKSELGLGTESESYAWETSPAYPWFKAADDSVDGVDSVRSCEMDGDTTSWMQTAVVGPATLTFAYKMRTCGGAFTVTCDGETLFGRSGEDVQFMDWTRLSLAIPAGTHVVRFAYTDTWEYWLDGGDSNGVRIDRVAFDSGSPAGPEFTVTDDGVLTKVNLRGATSVEIPAGVKSIAPYAFACNADLASVKVPDTVTRIGEYAFAGCSGLTSASLPNTLRSGLDSSVFHRCAAGLTVSYYEPTYKIRFHRYDASDEKTAEYEFPYGRNARLPALNSMGWARRGFDFKGWALSAGNATKGIVWNADWAIVSKAAKGGETLDVYAVWSLKPGFYAIQFIRNDGAGTWRTVGFQYGEKTRMPTLAKGLGWGRRGYQFNGWAQTAANANNGIIWKGDWGYVATPVAAGNTLLIYASWTLKPGYYQIRFNKNDGTGKWRTLGFECGASAKLNSIAGLGWERDGYMFRGWGSNAANAAAGKVWKLDGAWIRDVTAEGKTLSIYAIW